jgi:hypothetical protein
MGDAPEEPGAAALGGKGGRCARGGMKGDEENDERTPSFSPQAAHGRPPQRSAPLFPPFPAALAMERAMPMRRTSNPRGAAQNESMTIVPVSSR